MARARNIKPGFFINEDLVELPFSTRLLFIGLWTIADREGRLDDRPRKIKMAIFPADNVDVEQGLSELHGAKMLVRYSVGGRRYIQIHSFVKHQQPHYKEVASQIPPPPGHCDSEVVSFGVTEMKRQEIFDRDGRKCLECGSTERLSLDHIVPRSRGGSEDDDNLQTLCGKCNASKNNRIDSEATSGQRRTEVGLASGGQATPLTSSLNPSTLNPSTLNPERGDGETPPALETSDTLEHHPLISGIKEVSGRHPPKEIWDDLTGQVGANVDQAKLKTCFTKWRARGFNPQNFQGWAVDWYLHGIPEINAMEKRSNGQQPKLTEREKSAQRGRNIRQIADEYERQGREELAREALLLGSDQDHHQDHIGG